MARRSDHTKEELKNLIFKSAKSLVEKKGIEGLSARKLAAKIKYTPGTIYSFYKNIDDLVMHINADTLDTIYAQMQGSTNCNNEKSIQTIAETYLQYSQKNYNLWTLLFDYQYTDKLKLSKWYLEKVKRNFSLLEKNIIEICKNKSDAKSYARVFWAGLHGIVTLSTRGKLEISSSDSSEKLVDLFIKNFLNGLKT